MPDRRSSRSWGRVEAHKLNIVLSHWRLTPFFSLATCDIGWYCVPGTLEAVNVVHHGHILVKLETLFISPILRKWVAVFLSHGWGMLLTSGVHIVDFWCEICLVQIRFERHKVVFGKMEEDGVVNVRVSCTQRKLSWLAYNLEFNVWTLFVNRYHYHLFPVIRDDHLKR